MFWKVWLKDNRLVSVSTSHHSPRQMFALILLACRGISIISMCTYLAQTPVTKAQHEISPLLGSSAVAGNR